MDAIRRRLTPAETIEGYEHPELIDVVFQKTAAIPHAPTPAPDFAGARTVFDFGGGCGIHYRLAGSATVRWAVIETPAMVKRAADLETDRLRFFDCIDAAAAWLGHVDLVHSEGALQYAAEPAETLARLCALRATRMLWSRLTLSTAAIDREIQSSWLGDNGPGRLRKVASKKIHFPRTRIPEPDFLAAHASYQLTGRGPDWFRFQLP